MHCLNKNMKLLVIAQKVDINDDLLGAFHNWIAGFAMRYEKVTVICLSEGEYDLPSNVKVLNLGKQNNGGNKIETCLQTVRFAFHGVAVFL